MIDIAKIQRLFSPQEIQELESKLIYRESDGSYMLFNGYRISGNRDEYWVWVYSQKQEHAFSALKYALCWCINNKRNRILAQKEIVDLDRKLIALNFETKVQTAALKRTSNDIHSIKLNESTLHRQLILKKMSEYIQESDRWQTSKFGRSLNLYDK